MECCDVDGVEIVCEECVGVCGRCVVVCFVEGGCCVGVVGLGIGQYGVWYVCEVLCEVVCNVVCIDDVEVYWVMVVVVYFDFLCWLYDGSWYVVGWML